jgi:uncharacterized protein YkwD
MGIAMSRKKTKVLVITLSSLVCALIIGLLAYSQTEEPPQPTPTHRIVERTPRPAPVTIEVERIVILLDSKEVVKGTRFLPEVILQPEDATNKFFELRSDNEEILRPRGHHWIAENVGTANLIATAANGVTEVVAVTVLAPDVESLAFTEEEKTMAPGDIARVDFIITPEDALLDEPVQFSSDDEGVATVSQEGEITAVGAGTATINATVGDISAQLKVTVVIPVRSINITMDRRVYSVGEQAKFTIEIDPPNATNAEVTVSFAGASVTSTGENTFVCNAAGEVAITFTAENGRTTVLSITVHDLVALANEVHRLTNIERANLGFSQLGVMSSLTQTAIVRANEIIQYFSHTRPDGRDCFTAFQENGIDITSRLAGENLAAGQRTAAEAVQSWMDSPGHRENILNRDFGHLGVGVTIDNNGRLYWAQAFTD